MKVTYDKIREKFIITESDRTEYFQVKLHLTRHVKNYKYTPKYKLGVWDGTITHFQAGEFNLGLWKEIRDLFKLNNWKFILQNKEDFPVDNNIKYEHFYEFCQDFFKNHKQKESDSPFFPYEHQLNAAFNALKYKYCLVEVATGGGKSLIFALFAFYILKYINPDAKFLLIVPNISLVTQFYNDLYEYNLGFNKENKNPLDLRICEIMSDRPRMDEGESNIFIGTYQSLEKRPKEWFKHFYSVVTDEAHKSGSGSKNNDYGMKQVEKVLKYTFGYAQYRFGMSGTFPSEETLDWLTVQSLHGPKIVEVQAKELIAKGVISDVKIKTLLMNYDDTDFNDNLSIIRRGNGRGAFELEKRYIHESTKRLDFITNKIISKTTKNALVLFNIIEYGQKIYDKLRSELPNHDVYYIDGEIKKDKREYIKNKLEKPGIRSKIGKIIGDSEIKDRPKILVASFGTLSTGVSIKNLHYVIFMESFKSEQIIIQSIGRILRLHKDKDMAIVFDLVDIFDDKTTRKNTLYQHYLQRKQFYNKREYPIEEIKVYLGNSK